MAINGGEFTQDFRTQLRKYSDGTSRIGEEGRLWYNNSDQTLRVSDGSTEGGIVLNSGGGGGGSSGVTVQEEGSSLSTKGTTLNFVGTGITATGTGATKTITVDASAITVQDEGSALSTAATVLNFVGSGVTASGTGATKTITISGGGGGGGGDVADDSSPQLGGDLDIAGFNITSAVSNQNINIVPNGTGKLVLDGDFLPATNVTYNLGSSSFRWKDLFLSGDTIDLAGSTISSDGTGTINISGTGVTLPSNSKTEDERPLATLSANNSTNQVVVVTPFFSNAGGIVTKNAEFEFNATVDNQPVFTGTGTFTLANGDSFAESSIVLFQL
jgi:hypothetical protein